MSQQDSALVQPDPAATLAPPASVWAAIYLGVAAATLPAVLPVMIGIFAEHFGYSLAAAGMIASVNMGGILLGSLICPRVTRQLSWAAIIHIGLAVMIVGNLLTMIGTDFYYVGGMRFMSGVGEGLVGGICYGAMARAIFPERSVSFYYAGQAVIGVIGLGSFGYVASQFGWQWLFLILSLIAAPGFFLASTIGRAQPPQLAPRVDWKPPVNPAAIFALAAILIYFVGMASIWSFLERIAVVKGLSSNETAIALSLSAAGGFAGALAAAALASRLSMRQGLLIGSAVLILSIAGILAFDGFAIYTASACLFTFAWPFLLAFQFGFLARADRFGRMGTLMPAMTGSGLAIGPAMGGVLLQYGGLLSVCIFGLVCAVGSAAGMWLLKPAPTMRGEVQT
jgi:predicted MFS family arabinose efflux permease